jgi:hypothetical protein
VIDRDWGDPRPVRRNPHTVNLLVASELEMSIAGGVGT